jgi:hypothetical protein
MDCCCVLLLVAANLKIVVLYWAELSMLSMLSIFSTRRPTVA